MKLFLAFIVVFILVTASNQYETKLLHCIQCTHIHWDQLNKTRFENVQGPNTSWIMNITKMLNTHFSPACVAQNPDTWTPNSGPQYQGGGADPAPVDPDEAACRSSAKTNRCNCMYGKVAVYLYQYEEFIQLQMYIRNCIQLDPMLEDKCYKRSTIHGQHSNIRTDFENAVRFLGPKTHVNLFDGMQCLYSRDRCSICPQVDANVTVSAVTMLAATVAYFLNG